MICEQHFRLNKDGKPSCRCFCRNPELIENYDKAIADKTQVWECHHRMEAIYTKEELIKYGLYYDREPHQLIFLTKSEHIRMHNLGNKYWKGKKHSEEAKEKIRNSHKGKKRETFSEEWKSNMSKSHKGKNTWNTEKNLGRHWYTNGKINVFRYECPEGFTPGRVF